MRVRRALLFRPLLKYSPPTISAEANIKVFFIIIRKGYNLLCQREMFCLAVKGFYSFKKKLYWYLNVQFIIGNIRRDKQEYQLPNYRGQRRSK